MSPSLPVSAKPRAPKLDGVDAIVLRYIYKAGVLTWVDDQQQPIATSQDLALDAWQTPGKLRLTVTPVDPGETAKLELTSHAGKPLKKDGADWSAGGQTELVELALAVEGETMGFTVHAAGVSLPITVRVAQSSAAIVPPVLDLKPPIGKDIPIPLLMRVEAPRDTVTARLAAKPRPSGRRGRPQPTP